MSKKSLTLSDLVVLSILSEQPMHGYQLMLTLKERDAKDWAPVSRPQIYYSLTKLKELKLISKSKGNHIESLGPDKTIYQISQKGIVMLNNSLTEDRWSMQRNVPPFLTWMALSSKLPTKETEKVIKKRKVFLKSELTREETTLFQLQNTKGDMVPAAKLMVSFTISQFKAELHWLDEVESVLQKARKS